jgi:GNAT superfamily N-acetyltransferase
MEEALALVWEGFSDFQAEGCSEETIDEFWSSIDQEYMIQQYGDGTVRFWGAFEDDFMVGVCAIREMRRVELLYVDAQYHRLGIGSSLLKKAVMDTKEIALDMDRRNVNAAPYSVPFFKAMGFGKEMLPTDAEIERMRNLSSRVLTIEVLTALRDAGIDTPPLPCYIDNIDDAIAFVNTHARCVVKAPWSGSGRGIMWGIGHAEEPMVHFCRGVIRRQGGVVCEHFLNAKVEFAMEFYAGDTGVEFAGYSLFTAENGAYTGNVLATNEEIERILSEYITTEELVAVRNCLCGIMQKKLSESGYRGYFGIDMMLYDNGDGCRLNPCMEINLRMNMGVVARLFYDRYVRSGSRGAYRVRFFKQAGEALRVHQELQAAHPLKVENGKVIGGYMNLAPVAPENRYMAYVIIGENIY